VSHFFCSNLPGLGPCPAARHPQIPTSFPPPTHRPLPPGSPFLAQSFPIHLSLLFFFPGRCRTDQRPLPCDDGWIFFSLSAEELTFMTGFFFFAGAWVRAGFRHCFGGRFPGAPARRIVSVVNLSFFRIFFLDIDSSPHSLRRCSNRGESRPLDKIFRPSVHPFFPRQR